ncbi:hypothetical protein [Mesorhizobium sp.]|nr:hypothetical protein [Mesorhizobium sp.]
MQQSATPRHIYDDPANLFVAGFIGSPPMNFSRASWSRVPSPARKDDL